METSRFSFDLPDRLIAQHPTDRREDARLLVDDAGTVSHRRVSDLVDVIPRNALLVINDTRVRKARVYAHETSNGRPVEILFLDAVAGNRWHVLARRPGRNPERRRYVLPGDIEARLRRDSDRYELESELPLDEAWFEKHGHMPLPPYIEREDESVDAERYQTVFARRIGSAAAPTAGLHLTEAMLLDLESRGVEIVRVTLHVGTGTFTPVRTDRVEDHTMHTERYEVSAEAASAVNRAKACERPVVAVGTTSVRTLESAWVNGALRSGEASSDLFIYPGYRFKVVDELLTNFHTPRSSLLMLVCAFAGTEHVLDLYREAVSREYRFFSYGDAMYLRPAIR